MARPIKAYNLNGFAGLAYQRTIRGRKFSVYNAAQAGLDADEPWVAVCETHGSMVGASSLKLAKSHSGCPDWCEGCQKKSEPPLGLGYMQGRGAA